LQTPSVPAIQQAQGVAGKESGQPMSLFQCSKCHCAEDTALCHYWSARLRGTAPICSACDPKIGKWHADFDRAPFQPPEKREVEQWLGISLDIPEPALPRFSARSDKIIRSLIGNLP
jgi:hypothetical protein